MKISFEHEWIDTTPIFKHVYHIILIILSLFTATVYLFKGVVAIAIIGYFGATIYIASYVLILKKTILMTYDQLAKKIQSMTAKEIILAMIDGLKNPVTEINMDTYGETRQDGLCYGCAATNTICKLGDFDPKKELPFNRFNTPTYSRNNDIIGGFENAINYLRSGCVALYNQEAEYHKFATIKNLVYLPVIDDNNYKDSEILQQYINLANQQ